YFFMPDLAGGLYISYGNIGTNASLTSVLAEANWFVMHDRALYVGAKLGLGFASTSSISVAGFNIAGTSQTALGFGPAVGYLYPITPVISVGGEANYLIYTTSGSSTNVFNILAQGVYYF